MSSSSRPTPYEITSPSTASPLSQYPFPPADTTWGRPGQNWHTRRDSTASSIASIGGALDSGVKGHQSSPEASPNAISTLLQPPIVRTGLQPHNAAPMGGFKAPTQKEIPPVTLTNIPHIEAKSFQPYITQVGSLYEAFQRARQENEGETSLFRRDRKTSAASDHDTTTMVGQRPVPSRTASITSPLMSPAESPMLKRRQSAQRRLQAVTPLSTIPQVYFEEDFHLENPRTFEIVSERSEIIRDPHVAPTGRKTLAANAILQEKLSWYMDTVEVHLIGSISTASKSFFSALGSLRELHSEAANSVGRIRKLRKELSRLDRDMAKGGLKVVKLKQRRANIRKLAESMMRLDEIVSSVRKCEDMVNNDDIETVLDEIDGVEKLIAGQTSVNDRLASAAPSVDLRRIVALNGVNEDLNQLRAQVGRAYEKRFHNSLLHDLRRHVEVTERNITLQRWGVAFTRLKPGQRRGPSTIPSYMSQNVEFRRELESEMKGLARTKHTLPAATTFRALFLREMKNTIKKQLPSSNEDDNVSTISASTAGGRQRSQQERSSTLARNLRATDAEDSYAMLANIYTNVSEGLRRLSVQVKLLLDITSSMPLDGSKSSIKSPDLSSTRTLASERGSGHNSTPNIAVQAEVQQALDLSSLLGEAVDTVQQQITKVVRVRSQQTAETSLANFLRFFTLHRLFADECEAISGRSGMALKSVVDGQIKEYVSNFGNVQRHDLVERMDSDKWDAKDFGNHEKAILTRIMESSTTDITSWSETCLIWISDSQGNGDLNGSVTNGHPASSGKDKVRAAIIDEQKFILPESAMAMLRTMERFQHLTVGIPGMAMEIASSLLDTLKLFNSRSSQLILGAGATRSAGLKNITTKHLALSSQSLGFIIALVPYVREFFRKQMPSSTGSPLLADFDKVKRLFQEHQNSIHEKLVDIMTGRASMHVASMKKMDWDQAAQNTSQPVSPYMEVLTKETATLQKVLAKHLSEPVVMSILSPVFTSYREQWSKAYQEVALRSVAAKERMLADAEYFNSRVSKLDGSADLGDHIVNVVKAKPVLAVSASAAEDQHPKPFATSEVEPKTSEDKQAVKEPEEAQGGDAIAPPAPPEGIAGDSEEKGI